MKLVEFLTNIANSIRYTEGSTDLVSCEEMADRVKARADVEDGIVNGTVVDYENNRIIRIWANAFRAYTNLRNASFGGELWQIDSNTFQDCSNLVFASFKCRSNNACQFRSGVFYNCSNLVAVVINADTMPIFQFNNAFNNSLIYKGKGWIYFPSALVEEAKATTNLSTVASQIVAIEDYELKIVQQPFDIVGAVGDLVKSEIVAMAIGVKWQWQISDNNGLTWRDTTAASAQERILTFNITNEMPDGRILRCVVTDKYGSEVISDAVSITIGEGSVIVTKQPQNIVCQVGDTVQISVAARSTTGTALTYKWELNSGDGFTNTTATGYTTDTITLSIEEKHDGRQYRCIITDENGYVVTSQVATVTLGEAITITKQPEDVEIAVGGVGIGVNVATFTVEAVSNNNAELSYQWQYNAGNGWYNRNTTDTKTNTIVVEVSDDLAGKTYQYRCIITDENGSSVTSDVATMEVSDMTLM